MESIDNALAQQARPQADPSPTEVGRAALGEGIRAWETHDTGAGASPRQRLPRLERQDRPDRLPLSLNQQLWYDPTAPDDGPPELRRTPATFCFSGPFSQSAMVQALRDLLQRHEILRTRYGHDADGSFQIVDGADDLRLSRIDLSDRSEPDQRRLITAVLRAAAARDSELEQLGPLQAWVFKLRPDLRVLALMVDHIALDNRSVDLVTSEVVANYLRICAGRPDTRPPLPLQYADYAIWAQATDASDKLRDNMGFWRRRLGETAPSNLRLTGDWTEVRPSARQTQLFSVSADVTRRARDLARDQGVTLPIVLVAAASVLFGAWARQEKVLTGFVVQRRPQLLQDAVGAFVRNAPLFMDLSGDPTGLALVERARQAYLDANDPGTAILPKSIPHLGQVLLNIQTQGTSQLASPARDKPAPRPDRGAAAAPAAGLSISRWRWEGHLLSEACLDLHIYLTQHPDRVEGRMIYAAERLDPEAVQAFARRAPAFLEALAEQPQARLSQLLERATELEAQNADHVGPGADAVS